MLMLKSKGLFPLTPLSPVKLTKSKGKVGAHSKKMKIPPEKGTQRTQKGRASLFPTHVSLSLQRCLSCCELPSANPADQRPLTPATSPQRPWPPSSLPQCISVPTAREGASCHLFSQSALLNGPWAKVLPWLQVPQSCQVQPQSCQICAWILPGCQWVMSSEGGAISIFFQI